jgi:hypothetical protein
MNSIKRRRYSSRKRSIRRDTKRKVSRRRTRRHRHTPSRTLSKKKTYDLYNGKKWNNYRLGDVILGRLACWASYCGANKNQYVEDETCDMVQFDLWKGWCKDYKQEWTDPKKKTRSYLAGLHTNFPNSIASQYIDLVGWPDDYQVEHHPTIKKIFKNFSFKKPTPSTLVIHLRLGDVVAKDYGDEYAYTYEYYEKLFKRIQRNKKIKRIDIVTGLHKNVYVKQSNEILQKIVHLFETNYPVNVIITKDPDKDFYYMCHSKSFAPSGGGFSALITSYLKYKKNSTIYEKK